MWIYFRCGYGYPCRTNALEKTIFCAECGFVFPNQDCFDYHRLNQLPIKQQRLGGKRSRYFKSICESRYKCDLCHKVVWQHGNKKHECSQPKKQNDICYDCGGAHDENQPCFIQPVLLESLNVVYRREKPDDLANIPTPWNPEGDESNSDEYDRDSLCAKSTTSGDDRTHPTKKFYRPYRYFIFDIECSQDNEFTPGRFKHVPMLVCAEQICTRCIEAGIRIDATNNPRRPIGCVCKWAKVVNGDATKWVVKETEGRKLQFHNFDDPRINPLTEMIDFLTNHGPSNITTIALSHNGIYDQILVNLNITTF